VGTLRSDIVIPEFYSDYLIEATTVRNSFLTSGIATPLEALNAEEGGDFRYIPFWDANLAGDAERLTDTSSLTPGKITADKQKAVINHRGRAFESRDLAKMAAGDDPLAAIGAKLSDYVSNQQQKDLIATLNGAFGVIGTNDTTALQSLRVDGGGSGETALSPRQIAQAQALLLENGPSLDALLIHPYVMADLVERKAIDYVTAAEARVTSSTIAANLISSLNAFGGSVAAAYEANTMVPFYMGMRVIVSKDCPVVSNKYGCYVFRAGAIGTGQQASLRSETDRDILAKSSAIALDWHEIYHPQGLTYGGAANPTTADLATIGNWTLVGDIENVGVVRITVTSNFD